MLASLSVAGGSALTCSLSHRSLLSLCAGDDLKLASDLANSESHVGAIPHQHRQDRSGKSSFDTNRQRCGPHTTRLDGCHFEPNGQRGAGGPPTRCPFISIPVYPGRIESTPAEASAPLLAPICEGRHNDRMPVAGIGF